MSTIDATRPSPPTATVEPLSPVPPAEQAPVVEPSTAVGTAVGDVNTAATATSAALAVEGVSVVEFEENAVEIAEASAQALADTIDGPVVIAAVVTADLDVVTAAGDTAATETATVAGAVVVEANDAAPSALAAAVVGTTVIVPVIGEISAPVVEVMVRWKDRLLVALPWISLIFAVVGAVWMDREPSAAWFIVGAAVVGWVLVVITAVVVRKTMRVNVVQPVGWKQKGAALFMIFASQSVMQTALAFPLPFFFRAASWWPPVWIHLPFVAAYIFVLVVSSWDPWYERCAAKPLALFSLQAFSAFVALLTVLPIFGLTNTQTFITAGMACAVGVPVGLMMFGPRRWRTPLSVWAGVMVAVLVVVGAPLIPPVPLSLSKGVMGTHVVDRLPMGVASSFQSPHALVCHTAVRAPLGLKDTLVHVWTRDGKTVQVVPLEISGGADTGFRTWSRMTSPKPGRYRCRIETERGQVVGDVRATVR